MPHMLVTLEVSRLSGWLNADAFCQVERGAYEVGVGPVTRRSVAERRRRKRHADEGPNWGLSEWHARGAHLKHEAHVCDFGRVETQRLVERRRFLPPKGGHTKRGAGKDTGGGSSEDIRA